MATKQSAGFFFKCFLVFGFVLVLSSICCRLGSFGEDICFLEFLLQLVLKQNPLDEFLVLVVDA